MILSDANSIFVITIRVNLMELIKLRAFHIFEMDWIWLNLIEFDWIWLNLIEIQTYKVNLSHIESRPSKRIDGAYEFVVEIDGSDADVDEAIEALRQHSPYFQIITRNLHDDHGTNLINLLHSNSNRLKSIQLIKLQLISFFYLNLILLFNLFTWFIYLIYLLDY